MAPAPAKHYVCTHNNPDDDTEREYVIRLKPYSYLIVGHEVGESGTPHLQMYCAFSNKIRITGILNKFRGGHWEVARGTPEQNREYCSKGGMFSEYGILPRTGGETQIDKWDEIHQQAKANDSESFYEKNPMISFLHPTKFRALVKHYKPKPVSLDKIDAHWFLGPSGSGKSSTFRTEYPDYYLKDPCNKWWPNYNYEDVVLIDDLSKTSEYMLTYMKTWVDHYPFVAEEKHADTGLIRPKTIVVTSQYHWDEITQDLELRAAIARRFAVRVFGSFEPPYLDLLSATFDQGQFDPLDDFDS